MPNTLTTLCHQVSFRFPTPVLGATHGKLGQVCKCHRRAIPPELWTYEAVDSIQYFLNKEPSSGAHCTREATPHPKFSLGGDERAGVPEASIIIEDTGHDPIESAKACGRLLKSDSSLQSVKSAFLVSSAWHLLRMSIVMKRYVPNKVTLYCHAATEGVTASNWQTSPQNRAIVENELRLIEKLLKTGFSLK